MINKHIILNAFQLCLLSAQLCTESLMIYKRYISRLLSHSLSILLSVTLFIIYTYRNMYIYIWFKPRIAHIYMCYFYVISAVQNVEVCLRFILFVCVLVVCLFCLFVCFSNFRTLPVVSLLRNMEPFPGRVILTHTQIPWIKRRHDLIECLAREDPTAACRKNIDAMPWRLHN